MKRTSTSSFMIAISAALLLSGCSGMGERLSNIGKAPEMAKIENPYYQKGYHPVSLPMPPQMDQVPQKNSLWQASRQTFFKDQRAHKVGDILTVMIDIADEASLKNKTERKRDGDETQSLPSFLGMEGQLTKVLPEALNPSSLVGMESSSNSAGDGKIEREEEITLKLAAMVTQVLPNGNFVIQGSQQVRVNTELRDLRLQGVIRPEDILNNNSISYEKIAEARISYGGQGIITDLQQPRYGQQFFDAVFPF